MNKEPIEIICRSSKLTDIPAVGERITLSCLKHNDIQYTGKEELEEHIFLCEENIKQAEERAKNPQPKNTNTGKSRYSAMYAEVDGKVVGWTVTHELQESEKLVPDADIELDRIAVLPEYQSKGVGRVLWTAMIDKMKQNNQSVLQLWVVVAGPEDENGVRGKGNENAINFYLRQGCKFVDKTRQYKSTRGIPESKLCVSRGLVLNINSVKEK